MLVHASTPVGSQIPTRTHLLVFFAGVILHPAFSAQLPVHKGGTAGRCWHRGAHGSVALLAVRASAWQCVCFVRLGPELNTPRTGLQIVACDDSEVMQHIGDAHVAVPFMAKLDETVLSVAQQLRMVIQYGAGVETTDIAAVRNLTNLSSTNVCVEDSALHHHRAVMAVELLFLWDRASSTSSSSCSSSVGCLQKNLSPWAQATRLGIWVSNIPSADTGNALSCAEHIMYLTLALLRRCALPVL